MSLDPLTQRAFAAYFRECSRKRWLVQQPANSSGLVTHNGKDYVVLENIRGTLAVYRVRNDGKLKALKRWPKEIAA